MGEDECARLTSANSLFLSRQNSRCVNHADALQHGIRQLCTHEPARQDTREGGGRAGDLKETGQKCKTFKTTSTVPGQTAALSSTSAFLRSLQLNKLVRLSKVAWVKPPPLPPPPAPLRQSACILSVHFEESVKRFWLFFRRMRRESCGSADTQEAIRRVNPSQSALGNSITKECRALASTVARTRWSPIPMLPLWVLPF